MQKLILVTGGTGYIGSHTCIALAEKGYFPIIIDNLCNSQVSVVDALEKIIGFRPLFFKGDIRDTALLDFIFTKHPIDSVLHFAALKAVGESVADPLSYYDNHINGLISLLTAMRKTRIKTMVFSSSATVYGNIPTIPYQEDHPKSPINPYGRCKIMAEEILADIFRSEPGWRFACLRYFNPIGAHKSGLLGENPLGKPNNLMPLLCEVATGKRAKFYIYGQDYPTQDGTCVRDYIHVMDVANGHFSALKYLEAQPVFLPVNLGSGQGKSILEIIEIFEAATGCRIPYEFANRRQGDLPAFWADPNKAKQILGWEAKLTIQEACEDTWRWQKTYAESATLCEY